jgi:hypothetical protein
MHSTYFREGSKHRYEKCHIVQAAIKERDFAFTVQNNTIQFHGTQTSPISMSDFPVGIVLMQGVAIESGCECGRNHSNQKQCRAAQRIEPVIKHMLQHVNQPVGSSR